MTQAERSAVADGVGISAVREMKVLQPPGGGAMAFGDLYREVSSMSRRFLSLASVLTTVLWFGGIAMAQQSPSAVTETASSSAAEFKLTSPDIVQGKLAIKHFLSASPHNFGCLGDNLSPRLCWQGAPAGTKSFVLMVHDLDAPTGIGWMHWVVINIPASATELPQGVSADGTGLPAGALQTRTDFGDPGYFGPCPPQSPEPPHRYLFTLFAITEDKDILKLGANAMPALVALHALGKSHGKATLEVKLNR